MIDQAYAGCGNPIQDVFARSSSNTSNISTSTSGEPAQHRLTAKLGHQPASSSQAPPNFQPQAKPDYLQKQTLLQPLLAPHLLLSPAPASALAAIGPTGSGPPHHGNGSAQFALTPDARACVTATYLCVLIVNNTWLDCNLLEMLCNGNGTSGAHSAEAAAEEPPEDLQAQLGALEAAVNELFAFAGGGEPSGDQPELAEGPAREHAYPGRPGHHLRPNGAPPRPAELHNEGGGGPGAGGGGIRAGLNPRLYSGPKEDGAQLLLYSPSASDLDDLLRLRLKLSDVNKWPQIDSELVLKSGRLGDEAHYRLLEKYFSLRRLQLKRQKAPQRRPADKSPSSSPQLLYVAGQLPANASADLEQVAATTQPPAQSVPNNQHNSLVSWVGRPFRSWSSYSFWSADATPPSNSAQAITVRFPEEQQPSEPKQQIQILRPIDRTEQFNDIATNQTLKLTGNLGPPQYTSQSRPYHDKQQHLQQQEKAESLSASHNGIGFSNQPPSLFSIGQAPAFNELLVGDRYVQQQQQQLSRSTTPSSYDYGLVKQRPADELQSQHLMQQQQQQHLQQQRQFNQQPDESPDCKCHEMLLEDQLSLNDCRFRCRASAGSTQQPSMQVETTQVIGSFSTPPSSSASSGPASSTPLPASGGKMNPLDVTFILYTRYHRHLVAELAGAESELPELRAGSQPLAMNSSSPAGSSGISVGEPLDLINETTLSESRLNSSLPIKIVIHGFGSGGRRPWVTDMVYKLLDYEDVNVIVVDWEKGAALPKYVQAAGNTRLVGHKIACLIKSINAKYGLTGNSYHLIGFSLGAHVAGFAGMEIRNSTSVSRLWINRITGLDPASPLFEGYEASERLDPSDAQFVDVIHSNGDGVLRGGFGSLQPMGHVDFYPNGGRVQVGCNSVLLSALSDIIYGKWQSLCNHRRALNFFMDSFEFSKCRFRSFNCDSYESYLKGECFDCGFNNEKCSNMGYLANYSKGRGKMYLTTHEEAPFCANQFTIKIVGTKGFKSNWGKVEVTLVTHEGKNESFWLSSMSQQSASHESSGGLKEPSQDSMQSLIVAHPGLINFTQVLLRYTKYKGWIYSGDESWSIDKVYITDSDGQTKSFCGFNTVLESHITSRLNLEPGNCTVVEAPSMATQSPAGVTGQQISRGNPAQANGELGSTGGSAGVVVRLAQQQQQRTPRLFAPTTQTTQNQAPHGHVMYPRMASERQQGYGLGYNNIPFVAI